MTLARDPKVRNLRSMKDVPRLANGAPTGAFAALDRWGEPRRGFERLNGRRALAAVVSGMRVVRLDLPPGEAVDDAPAPAEAAPKAAPAPVEAPAPEPVFVEPEAAPAVDLDALGLEELRAFADARAIPVSTQWGERRLRAELRRFLREG